MTIKEAIRILESETPESVLLSYERYDGKYDGEKIKNYNDAYRTVRALVRMAANGCGRCKHFNETGYSNNDKEHPELSSGWCENLRKEVQAGWYCGDHAYHGDWSCKGYFESHPEAYEKRKNSAKELSDLLLKYMPTQSELEDKQYE